jgi:hypothetical protein
MEEEERNRRKTHGGADQMLPDVKLQQKKAKQAIGEREQPQTSMNQPSGAGPTQGSSHSGIRIKKQTKQIRGRSEMRDGSQMKEGYTNESRGNVGTASVGEEDRRSVVSKGSVSQGQKEPTAAMPRKNSNKKQQQQKPPIAASHRALAKREAGINEEYDDD